MAGTDYDQVSTWDSASGSWKHWVGDSDFNDFTEFEYGKTYEIYNKSGSEKSFTVTGRTRSTDITHNIVAGDNFISPALKDEPVSVTTVLSGLSQGTHYSDVKRYNAEDEVWESLSSWSTQEFEPGVGYNIIGLTNASFSYGETETTTTFVYDSTGARVKKTAGGETAIYLGKDYEVDDVTIKHIFLGDRRITTKKSSGEISYIHDDHISSSNVVTDASGNQSAMYEYDPYGATVTHTGAVDLKHQFTGQEKDDSTGLHYYNARYYDSQLGRFITADWIVESSANPQILNRYSYVGNNPIRYIDPTGNCFLVCIVIGAVIGAISAGIQSGWDGKTVATGALFGAIGGGVAGGVGSQFSNAFIGSIVGGAAGGATVGGLSAAYYGGDIGQGILSGGGVGLAGGALFGGINAGFDKFVTQPNFRWELVRVSLEGAAGGGLSKLSGGEFWEGVAFSSAIAGSKFAYKITTVLRDGKGQNAFWDSSNGQSAPKGSNQDVWGPETGTSNVGIKYGQGENMGFLKSNVTGESSPLMLAVSRVPGMNSMAYAHDIFMGSLTRGSMAGRLVAPIVNMPTIAPAVGITYLALAHEPAIMATLETYDKKNNKR